jgi:hypothetical protein
MAKRRCYNVSNRRLAALFTLATVSCVHSGPLEVSYILAHVNDTTLPLNSQGFTGTIPTEIGCVLL